jgi:hypothetical protein
MVRDIIPVLIAQGCPVLIAPRQRRPKPYPLLNRPRGKFVELPHRIQRWKGGPQNIKALTDRL